MLYSSTWLIKPKTILQTTKQTVPQVRYTLLHTEMASGGGGGGCHQDQRKNSVMRVQDFKMLRAEGFNLGDPTERREYEVRDREGGKTEIGEYMRMLGIYVRG